MSTVSELINADIKENSARHKRYWKASNLPVRERFKHRPKAERSPRDRVLTKLLKLNIGNILRVT